VPMKQTYIESNEAIMRQIERIILLIGVSAGFLTAQTDPPGRAGRLSYINGPVSLQPAGVTDWVDATINRPLTTGDHIWVGDGGQAEIHVGSMALRLNSDTAFQFLNLDDQTMQIQLSQGTLTARVRNFGRGQNFEIDTPSLAFTLLRPGEYRIGADPNAQTTTITVRDGDGEVTGGGQTFPIHAREQAIVTGGDQITYDVEPAPGPDAWDQWSASRDLRADRSPSARYVSREVPGYEDLDQYGEWSNQPGYGQVWRPSRVSADWAPYHDGTWAWVAPWGWTWVDDAPWGYAPSHYGRWASFGGRWGWVPGPLNVTPCYAPALVGWIGGGSGFSVGFSVGNAAAVGWFPLGPRDPYFPGYHSSQGYFTRVNNTNTTINNTTINNYYNDSRNSNNTITNVKYVNQNVRNAVTAVPQNTFASGRPVAQNARAVPAAQLASAHYAVAPAIAPQPASVLGPKAGAAASAPRPPATAFSRPVVARTAPPPPPVPFARQQATLAQNPGRPLAPAAVQQTRQSAPAPSSSVRIVDMSKVQRVQPKIGAGPQGAHQASSSPGLPATPNVVQRPGALQPPSENNRPSAPPNSANAKPNTPWSTPVVRPGSPSPTVSAPQRNTPPPNVTQRPGTPPPAAAAKPNDRWSVPVARPGSPAPAADTRQPNTPPTNMAQRPSTLPPTATAKANNRWSAPVAKPGSPSPTVNTQQRNTPTERAQRPSAFPPSSGNSRPSAPPPNVSAKPNDRGSAPVARPVALPPAANTRQQNTPPPNVAQRPSAPPPNRQQPAQTYRAPAPAQPNRPQEQHAQVQRPQVERPQPESRVQSAPAQSKPQQPKPEKKQSSDEKPGGR
jgi:hypothetical protein